MVLDSKDVLSKIQIYQEIDPKVAVLQLVTSFLPFFGFLIASYFAIPYSLWLAIFMSVMAGAFLLRIFMIQHDCGHGSFFSSRRANDFVGCLCSLFTMIPYFYWRRQHALHHAGNGNLDKRGHGDMDVLTVAEYAELSKCEKFKYRVYRNPLVFMTLGPVAFTCYINRLVLDKKKTSRKERVSVYITNLLLLLILGSLAFAIGIVKFAIIMLPMIFVAAATGIWLFYIQHQFEHTYWKHQKEWNYLTAAMQGSSFYRLSRPLQWITASIGFHHIHHLAPSIPNYRLEQCHYENPELQNVSVITLLGSLKSMFLCLWDEESQRLISMFELRRRYPNISRNSLLSNSVTEESSNKIDAVAVR